MIDQTTEKSYFTIAAIKTANRDAGHHFFSSGAMNGFDSRIGSKVYGGRFFITSEQFRGSRREWDGARLWTIRSCNDRGHINTVGDHQQYESPQAAIAAAKRMEWTVLP